MDKSFQKYLTKQNEEKQKINLDVSKIWQCYDVGKQLLSSKVIPSTYVPVFTKPTLRNMMNPKEVTQNTNVIDTVLSSESWESFRKPFENPFRSYEEQLKKENRTVIVETTQSPQQSLDIKSIQEELNRIKNVMEANAIANRDALEIAIKPFSIGLNPIAAKDILDNVSNESAKDILDNVSIESVKENAPQKIFELKVNNNRQEKNVSIVSSIKSGSDNLILNDSLSEKSDKSAFKVNENMNKMENSFLHSVQNEHQKVETIENQTKSNILKEANDPQHSTLSIVETPNENNEIKENTKDSHFIREPQEVLSDNEDAQISTGKKSTSSDDFW